MVNTDAQKRIKEVHEADCDFIESIDTTHPGLIEASRQLVAVANKMIGASMGEDDPVLAGELLLLAGYNALLYTNGSKPTNMAVHLKGLVLNGQPLPIQSIYIAMKESQATNPAKKGSPRSNLIDERSQSETYDPDPTPIEREGHTYPKHDPIPSMESALDYSRIQAELDSETSPEILDAAREFTSGAQRFADKPSVADQQLTSSLGQYQRPSNFSTISQITGLHGGHD